MILFIGEQPYTRTHPTKTFSGAACEARLKYWISRVLPKNETYEILNQVNLDFTDWTVWNNDYKFIIVALGNNASKALGSIPHFKLPHPSGRNRQINDNKFINNKLQDCRRYIVNMLDSYAESYHFCTLCDKKVSI